MSPRRPMRVLAVLLAFGAGLAVFAATRAGAPAAPPATAPALRPAPLGALRDAVRAGRPRQRDRAGLRAPPVGARDRRPRLPGARRDAAAPRSGARPARRRRGRRARHARRLAPRLPPRRWCSPAARGRSPQAPPRTTRCSSTRSSSSAASARPSARCSASPTCGPGCPPTPACPTCASCAATSPAPRAAMGLAVAAGGAAPENVAAVQALHGDLEAARGRPARAARDYAEALAGVPGFPPALAGARAARRRPRRPGRRDPRRCARVVERLPLPEHAIALGELQLAAGRPAAARRTFALVGAERRLLAGAGVDRDAELAVFEADHGSPRRAVALARRAWAAAPGIRAADALGWALTRAGRPPRGAGVGAPRAAARLARPAAALPRRHGRARRRAPPPPAARARARARRPPWQAARAGARAGGARDEAARACSRRSPPRSRCPRRPAAHPLGNFSVNHQARVAVSADRVDVTYMLDQAEIPTFQERGRPPPRCSPRKRAEIARGLALDVDGRPVPLRARRRRASVPARAGRAADHARRARARRARDTVGRRVRLRDGTFAGRAGWRAIVAVPGRGTAVRSSVPSDGPDRAPDPLPARPARRPGRRARGGVRGARRRRYRDRAAGGRRRHGTTRSRGEDGFAGAARRRRGRAVAAAARRRVRLGRLHALSPGHGKAMVAAYLVGTRGTRAHAVALGRRSPSPTRSACSRSGS